MTAQQTGTETKRIADQLRRIYSGPSWLGPTVSELISGLDDQRARGRPVPGAHTIWELVLHMAAWLRIARERLSASEERDASPAENWPEMLGSWQSAAQELQTEISALANAIEGFPSERLDERAPAHEEQTFYELLHGVIQHTAYHAGQIAILKKSAQ